MNRLIVTADDVGLHRGMTLGGLRAHREGIVTACSLAGAGPDLAHAIEALRGCPALDVGVHLMLTGGRPVSEPGDVPSLVTRRGTLLSGYPAFVARYVRGGVSLRDVEVELRAQLRRVTAAGVCVRHLNGHQHLHVLPGVADVVIRLAREHEVPYVRMPLDRMPAGVPAFRRAAVGTLGWLAERAARRARAAGLIVNDGTIGVADAGRLIPARLEQLFGLVQGLTELVTHPGVDGAAIARQHPWGYAWDAETDALCGAGLAAALSRHRVELVGIRQIAGKPSALEARRAL